ncbi:MAG: AAA domain-containing protein [Myxococcota bacterium]
MSKSLESLQKLEQAWSLEQAHTRQLFAQERGGLSLEERVHEGIALQDVRIDDIGPAAGDRYVLTLRFVPKSDGKRLRLRRGEPVVLWQASPIETGAVFGVLARIGTGKVDVIVEHYPSALLEQTLHLDREAPQVTFVRGQEALSAFLQAKPNTQRGHLREILWGDRVPGWDTVKTPIRWFDTGLNATQQEAIQHALSARDIACLHGPPGTGKTRTLIELIRQLVAQDRRVVVCAPSHVAVDNLMERLIPTGIPVLRLGHPARISAWVEEHTLDARLTQTQDFTMAKKWIKEAQEIFNRIERKIERREMPRQERLRLKQQARNLLADARRVIAGIEASLVAGAKVICTTLSSVQSKALASSAFDDLVLDEATQALDPLLLSGCLNVKRVFMAGDPHQLPPTVRSREAERAELGEVMFTRLWKRDPKTLVRMLQVQYRMHEALMQFSSQQFYEGKLVADPGNASHTLYDLGVKQDPLREHTLVLVDSAGKGWDEQREEGGSLLNLESAQRIFAEVQRLLGRGLQARDVGVVTPYKAQVQVLKSALSTHCAEGLEISTIDGFQGREKEAILLDCVRSNMEADIGFLSDLRRINVALTRAKRFLLILLDSATVGEHPFYAELIAYVQTHGLWLSAWTDNAPPFYFGD